MADMDEYYDGENVILTAVFVDKTDPLDPVKTDPSAASLVIQPGYDPADLVTIALGSMTHVDTGIYTFKYQTAGLTGPSGAPVECRSQIDCSGDAIVGVADPYYFRVLPKVSGLT